MTPYDFRSAVSALLWELRRFDSLVPHSTEQDDAWDDVIEQVLVVEASL